MVGCGGDGGGRFGGDEEGWERGDCGDYGDVECHVGYLRGFGREEWVYELPQRATEGICEGCDSCRRYTASGREPEI